MPNCILSKTHDGRIAIVPTTNSSEIEIIDTEHAIDRFGIECVPDCYQCIEKFLHSNSGEIPPRARAALREVAAKAIRDEKSPIDTSRCPAHLRDEFRRLVTDAAYKARAKGQFFKPKREYLP